MREQHKTEEKVFSYMEKYHMVSPGDRVVLGVSGGADSVCLFFLLLEYQKRVSFEMTVVHVNHGIRPDAGEDAVYVKKLCSEHGIPYVLVEADIRELARLEKCSEEDAGRRLRYRSFREIANKEVNTKIAVAHNAEDRAETMLMHLFRGSGLKGMCGIEPVRNDVIRPILCLERREIEAYLTAGHIPWQTDSTNAEDTYTRNRIRHYIIPYAEKEISENTVKHMCRTADLLSETESYMKQQTHLARQQCVRDHCISIERFHTFSKVIQKRILLELMEEMSPTGKDIFAVHVEDVMSLFEKEGNRRISLPYGISFRRQYTEVIATMESSDKQEQKKDNIAENKQVTLPKPDYIVFSYGQGTEIPQNKYTKWFDYDKIAMCADEQKPVLRYRKPGDFLTLADNKGQMIHKSLKEYMISEKIPKEIRGSIPVLAQGSHILWVYGYRISEYYKVKENTTRVLQVTLKTDCEDL